MIVFIYQDTDWRQKPGDEDQKCLHTQRNDVGDHGGFIPSGKLEKNLDIGELKHFSQFSAFAANEKSDAMIIVWDLVGDFSLTVRKLSTKILKDNIKPVFLVKLECGNCFYTIRMALLTLFGLSKFQGKSQIWQFCSDFVLTNENTLLKSIWMKSIL